MKRVHLDHNATTPMRAQVRERYLEALREDWANPSSVHAAGRAARARLDEARERVARALGVGEDEIVFTASATESIHLALVGAAGALGGGLVTSQVEHSAVLGAARTIAARGGRLVEVGSDELGRVDPAAFVAAANSGNIAVASLQAANNEVGTLQPLGEVAHELARLGRQRPLFHCDAVQALGRIPLDLAALEIDLASFSAHKVGGPLGVGVLFKRARRSITPLMEGGGQENDLRPGTENVPAIEAAALSIELAVREQAASAGHLCALVTAFWNQLRIAEPSVRLNGPPLDDSARLPNTLNLSFDNVESRTLVARLDLEGLEVSAGSACASGSLEPSHVLLAMGRSRDEARAGLRVSFARSNDLEDVHRAVEILRRTLRSMR